MQITATEKILDRNEYDAVILPFWGVPALCIPLPDFLEKAIRCTPKVSCPGSIRVLNVCSGEKPLSIIPINLGDPKDPDRDLFLRFAAALKKCKETESKRTIVLLENTPELMSREALLTKMCELPFLVDYEFTSYKTQKKPFVMERVTFVSSSKSLDPFITEGRWCAESTLMARNWVNYPSSYMTPERLAEEACKVGEQLGMTVEVMDQPAIERQNMNAFLAVGRAATDQPRLIVMRYRGAESGQKTTALIGKGIVFDSGGYTLKKRMHTMHNDMGGAAAVIGAIRSAAGMSLPLNITAIIPACKNMVSGNAFVPGDILSSKSGRSIEILSTDAEGRLLLADAMTYAVHEEGADELVDIATLTGSAKNAVGNKSAAVLSNSDKLYETLQEASLHSCEKIWRLNLDRELRPTLDSSSADLKSSNPDSVMGGGCIVAGLFLQEFVEDKPWIHIDMAPVNWLTEANNYCGKGATGYGVSLLYHFLKRRAMGN